MWQMPVWYIQYENIERHNKDIHPDKCNSCTKDRQETNGFIIEKCKFNTYKKQDIVKHIVLHKSQPNTKGCDKCNFTTDKKNDMHKHIKLVHCQPNTKACDRCKFKTYKKNNMDKNIISHHGQPNRKSCDNCSKCSRQHNNLQIHVKRHTGENHPVVRNVGNQATSLIVNKPINWKHIHAMWRFH